MNRYSRQIILPNFGESNQQKLSESKVLIVGAGGLGVPVLQYLVAAGIGTIGIADGDVLEISNLQRQVLYNESNLGKNKAKLAQEKLSLLNSEVKIIAYDFYINPNIIFEIINDYEIIVDCTDDFSIRYLLNDVCFLQKKPLVFSSIFQFEAQLSVFHYGEKSYNLRDIFENIPDANLVPNCNEAGVLGTLACIAGSLQANEVIKIITQIGEVHSGKLLFFNSLKNEIISFDFAKNSKVFLPKSQEEILNYNYGFSCEIDTEISNLEELNIILQNKNTILIDVRDQEEFPKIENFPILEIALVELINNFHKFEAYENIIFICKTGIRSKKAVLDMKHHFPNKKFYHCKNGITLLNHEN